MADLTVSPESLRAAGRQFDAGAHARPVEPGLDAAGHRRQDPSDAPPESNDVGGGGIGP